jgi:tetratricopeptide (TPR) repeat protein
MHSTSACSVDSHRRMARQRFAFLLALSAGFAASSASWTIGQEATQKKPDSEVVIPEQMPGDSDFDKAIQLRIGVDSMDKLREVISLVESALKKGLSKASEEPAKTFLASVYKQRVEFTMRELMQNPRSSARASKIQGELLDDLTRAIELDPSMVEGYLFKAAILKGRQDFGEAMDVVNAGIAFFEPKLKADAKNAELHQKLANLYTTRAGLQEDPEQQLEDVAKSFEINPNDTNVAKQYLMLLESQQKFDRLLSTLDTILEFDPQNVEFILSKVTLLLRTNKQSEAMEFSNKSISMVANDESKATLLRQRALIHQLQGNNDQAKADLDESIKLTKDNVPSMLLRARLNVEMQQYDAAKEDVAAILEADDQNLDALLLRADIAAEKQDYETAINDYKSLVSRAPDGARQDLRLKLALTYWQSGQSKQALRVLDQALRGNEDSWQAHRLRGEVLLGQGEHLEAVRSYEKALSLLPQEIASEVRSSLLNNLSWVLATSPEDDVRDGERALELGLKACELTEYKAAHILSTLAAAYAEKGNFEKAIEFSEKAVNLGREENSEQLEQLENELKNYKDGKPWREKHEAKP